MRDLRSQKFGRLTPIEFITKGWWLCRCDCGIEKYVHRINLQNKSTKSCGCLIQEILSKRIKKNNPAYSHGLRCNENTKEIRELKEKIRKRDNHTCQDCGKIQKENDKKLDVHHIDGNDTNNIEKNMITLCQSCHWKTVNCKK